MLKKIYIPLRFSTRKCATQNKTKPVVELNKDISESVKENVLKPRKHEGRVHKATIQLPKWIIKAMAGALEDYPHKIINKDAEDLYRYLNGRLPPLEADTFSSKYLDIRQSIEQNIDEETLVDTELDNLSPIIHNETLKMLATHVRPWAAIQYDTYRGLMYMLARGVQNYAILYKTMKEIQSRDKDFRPRTLLDFGSGIGTVSWVASELWHNSLKERMCVDISSEINEIAENIMKYANPAIQSVTFHRQFLPIASVPKFDIVVSSFSLMELPNRKTRIDVLTNLWQKTEKYLVIMEYGTKGGFQILSEARDYLIQLINARKKKDPQYEAFIFSPCPHEMECPQPLISNDPCKFESHYFQLAFDGKLIAQKEKYTYIVFKKGSSRKEKDQWPRIVKPVLVRSGHTICRMCTDAGKLQEIIFSKGKHERPLYRCAKASWWGDRLPIKIDKNKEE